MSDWRGTVLGLAIALVVVVGTLGLQRWSPATTPSPECNELTRIDLECAIERDWRAQARARDSGPGVVLLESCSLAHNLFWPSFRNERQRRYGFERMNLVGDLGSEETKVRIELKRDDGKAELAYLDAWHLADGEWQSLGCQWGVGSPILGYAPILDIDPSIYDRLGPETLPVLELAPLRPLERLRW